MGKDKRFEYLKKAFFSRRFKQIIFDKEKQEMTLVPFDPQEMKHTLKISEKEFRLFTNITKLEQELKIRVI